MALVALGLAAAALVVGSSAPPASTASGEMTRTERFLAVTADNTIAILSPDPDAPDTASSGVAFEPGDDAAAAIADGSGWIDGVALDGDGATAYIGMFVGGHNETSVFELGGDRLEPVDGSAPTLSPDGAAMAFVAPDALLVIDLESGDAATIETPGFTPWDVAWTGTDALAAYGVSDEQRYEVRLFDRASGTQLGAGVASTNQVSPWLVMLAGVDTDGALVVLDVPDEGAVGALHRFELPALTPLDDLEPLPAGTRSASLSGDGEQLLWIDADGVLRLDDGDPFSGDYQLAEWA